MCCPSSTALLNCLECPPDYNKRKVMMGHSDNEKPCIKQNTDSMRQVKWIASRVAERRSSVAVFEPRMRGWSITSKQDLFVGKYFELFVETVVQEVMIWLVGWGKARDTGHSWAVLMSSRSYICRMSPRRAYCHHSGRLGPMVAPVQIPLDL